MMSPCICGVGIPHIHREDGKFFFKCSCGFEGKRTSFMKYAEHEWNERISEFKHQQKIVPCICGSLSKELVQENGQLWFKCRKCGYEGDKVNHYLDLIKGWNKKLKVVYKTTKLLSL